MLKRVSVWKVIVTFSVMGETTGVSGALPFGVATVILDCNVQFSLALGRELGRCLSNRRG